MGEEEKEKLLHEVEKKCLEEEESVGKRVWEESKKMWVVAGPAIFTRFSTFGIMVVTQSFIGHIGSTELAAYALVMTVLVRFANGVLVSLSFLFFSSCSLASKYEIQDFQMENIVDWHGKCFGNSLWSSIWSQKV